jgi:hypothetical protein
LNGTVDEEAVAAKALAFGARPRSKPIPRLKTEESLADAPIGGEPDLGQEEALSLGRGLSKRDLAKEADEAEHDRSERFRNHFERVATWGLYIGALVILLAVIAWFWHIITPWHFLDPDQLSHLQNLVTGGVLVSVGTNYMKKRLGD